MRPILSIFFALIITILLFLGMAYLHQSFNISLDGFPFFAVIFLCGAIATWFSMENKIRYGVYYGIVIAVMYGFFLDAPFITLILIPIAAGMGGYIAKNDKDSIKKLLGSKSQIKYKSFFINLYNRNKIVLIASLVIFFASVLIGGIGPYLSSSLNHFMTNLTVQYLSAIASKGLGVGTTLSIFLNNSNIAFFYMYIGGILLGIPSILGLVELGLIIGFQSFKYPFTLFYILPHGIFELSSYVIAAAAGFKLLNATLNVIWGGLHIKRNKPVSEQASLILNANYLKFRDSLTLIVIAIVLLVIAAIIEANISMAFGNYITGLNIHSSFASYLLNLINH